MMNRDDFRKVIHSAIEQWVAAADPMPIAAHVDALDGQLNYLVGRVKTIPSNEMVSLVTDNIRGRLMKIRTLAGQAA